MNKIILSLALSLMLILPNIVYASKMSGSEIIALVIVSFIISVFNLFFFLVSISSLGQFGQAELSVWITIIVVLVVSSVLILMTFITPIRQYKKLQRSDEV